VAPAGHAQIVEAACAYLPVTTAMIGPDGLIHDEALHLKLGEALVALSTAI
jgi:hypothetical protein